MPDDGDYDAIFGDIAIVPRSVLGYTSRLTVETFISDEMKVKTAQYWSKYHTLLFDEASGNSGCTVCHLPEVDMPLHCPGFPVIVDTSLNDSLYYALVQGNLRFEDGEWCYSAHRPDPSVVGEIAVVEGGAIVYKNLVISDVDSRNLSMSPVQAKAIADEVSKQLGRMHA